MANKDVKRLLVLNIDIDNDLYEKVKVKGPIIGKKSCIEAAGKLALADPTDSDSNAIFEAVRKSDELAKEYTIEVACLTGDKRLGFYATREIVKQLEEMISRFKPDACVLVSDGASDDQVLPLIQSRIKINEVKRLTIRQAKELENTYFTILDKLKDPHYARIVFGIPGIALMLFAFSEVFGLRVFVGILGAYLVIKALGIEDYIFRGLHSFEFSFNKLGFIFYFAAIPLAAVSIWLGFSKISAMRQAGIVDIAKLTAGFEKDLLLLLAPAILLIIVGKFIEAASEKRYYVLPQYITYFSSVILLWLLFTNAAEWVLGNIGFADFFTSLALVIVLMLLLLYLAREFKISLVSKMQLEGKPVYTEVGGIVGKVLGVNRKKGTIVVATSAEHKFDIPLDFLASVDEKVIVKY
ncbi:MAG: DUF373 family protein [Candidatus Micrarchaeota archaeon]|nr:DUF373 family protein [Candidatus Micrarchaeota archaeon]